MSSALFTRSRRVIALAASTAMLLVSGAAPLFAQSEGSVSATVQATAACITVEAASTDFGANPFSTGPDSTGDVVAVGDPDTLATSGISYALTNCSASDETFLGSGTDAQNTDGTVIWTLDATGFLDGICQDTDGTTNRYRMDAVNDAANDNDLTGDSGVFLTTSAQTLANASAIAAGAEYHVGNRIVMPCSGSDGVGQVMSSSITYTAVLNS